VGKVMTRVEAKTQEDWHIEDVWVLFAWNWAIRRGREKAHKAHEALMSKLNPSRQPREFVGTTLHWLKTPMRLIQALFILSYLFDVSCDMLDQLSPDWDIPTPIKVGFDKGSYTFTVGLLIVLVIQKYGPRFLGRLAPAIAGDKSLLLVSTRLACALVVLATLMCTLAAFGIPAKVLFSFGGLGGLAFGLAAKDFISNLIGGLVLAVMRPFTVGEKIYLTGGGGKYRDSKEKEVSNYKVAEIGWYQTKLIPKDGKVTTIPNGYFLGANVINTSREPNEYLGPFIRLSILDYENVIAATDEMKQFLINDPDVNSNYKDPLVYMKKIEDDHLLVQIESFCYAGSRWKKNRERILIELIKIVRKHCPNSPALPVVIERHLDAWDVPPSRNGGISTTVSPNVV
jgi:small-conductance mechanosensitive channel